MYEQLTSALNAENLVNVNCRRHTKTRKKLESLTLILTLLPKVKLSLLEDNQQLVWLAASMHLAHPVPWTSKPNRPHSSGLHILN